MDATPGSNTSGMSAGRVFLSDSRLAFAVLNQGRHLSLSRAFGVSREEANLLTFVLALGATNAALATARRLMRGPFSMSGSDAGIGVFLMREAGLGIAGPAARQVPLVGTLVAVGMIGGLAVPELRRALRGIRAAEHRVREQRMRIYGVARRT